MIYINISMCLFNNYTPINCVNLILKMRIILFQNKQTLGTFLKTYLLGNMLVKIITVINIIKIKRREMGDLLRN